MKDKLTVIGILGTMFFFFVVGILKPADTFSQEERRKLAQVPKFSVASILDNTYFSQWNDYFADQFPYRINFRKLKGMTAFSVFGKREENNVIREDDMLYELNVHLNETSVNHFVNVLKNTLNTYNLSNNIYYSIIPDKNYYLEDDSVPKLSYNYLVSKINEAFSDYTYVSFFEELGKDSYYQTDIHWRQEKLGHVVKKLKLELELPSNTLSWEKYEARPFYGALKSRIPNNIKGETITYYSNDILENVQVYNYEKQLIEPVYQGENIHHLDGYDVFLGGASALLFIENERASTNKELIVFRDSFASSLIPLLIPDYKKITLIDLRYVASDYLKNIPEISWNSDADILLLYSVPIINQSSTLK